MRLGNVLNQPSGGRLQDTALTASGRPGVVIADGKRLDASGAWSNLLHDPAGLAPWRDGGSIFLVGSGDVNVGAGSVIDVSSGACWTLAARSREGPAAA